MSISKNIEYELSPEAQNEARDYSEALSRLLKNEAQITKLSLEINQDESTIAISNEIARLINSVLKKAAESNHLSITSSENEISTQEAANILNVSRPFLVKLLENGEIPFYMVGNRRRVKLTNVYAFKEKFTKSSDEALTKLAENAQALNLGYNIDK